MLSSSFVLDEDQPTEETRYRAYAIRRGNLVRLADTSKEGIGPMLVQLDEDGEFDSNEAVGLRDRIDRHWIVNPWARGQR